MEQSKNYAFFFTFPPKNTQNASSGRGKPWKIFFFCNGGSKIASGRGTVFWGVSLWESPCKGSANPPTPPPFPLPLPTYG